MLSVIRERWRQGHRTIAYPAGDLPVLPDRYRGLPCVDGAKCPSECRACADVCPTDALRFDAGVRIDMGRCLFCTDCTSACPEGAIAFTREFRTAARTRDALVTDGAAFPLARAVDAKSRRLFGRSLQLRQVSAGGCNACEADINVLATPVFDLGRFGIKVVASPRHADGIIVTGPVTANMRLALEKTYAAIPDPKCVIAVGACAISGGPFAGHDEQHGGCEGILPVDLHIPGCPPHPLTILDGILRWLGRIESSGAPTIDRDSNHSCGTLSTDTHAISTPYRP
ncbi:MAG: 4Fe-4S dicluster domain-containing protein [Planctomycetes bacterium]|nr:4Fe-4S dicluster domain-containing protein [Planctomycetota bacterium]